MPLPFLIPLLTAAGGALANTAAGAIGNASASGDKERQRALIDQILADYDGLDVPEMQQVEGEHLGPSAMGQVSTDPRLRSEQMAVLERLGRLSQTGGDAITKAAMDQLLRQAGRQEAAGRNAILGNMRARGVSGSGAELAAQLHNQQASADRAQSASLDQGAQAQKRMMDAIIGRGQMSGQMRTQDFGENSAKAQARDAIARYNAGERSRSNYYNAGLPAQQYHMNLQKLAGKSTAARGAADQAGKDAQSTATTWAGVGNAANTAMTGLASELSRNPQEDADERGY